MGKVVPLCRFVISGSVKNLDETMGMSTVLLVLFNAANRSGLITIVWKISTSEHQGPKIGENAKRYPFALLKFFGGSKILLKL